MLQGISLHMIQSERRKKVVYFNQTEEPWKGMSYGSSTIGASGCGPTSMAIIISTLTGQTVTPQMTCAYSIANGEYVPGMGTSHSFPTNAAYHWGLTCERVGKDRMNYVVQSLKEGKMVVEICEAYTITGSGSGHFIVLTGVTRDGYITIADCASRERTGKCTVWKLSNPMDVILAKERSGLSEKMREIQ